jgi:hypothetical protein
VPDREADAKKQRDPDPEQIQREIEQARVALASAVDEIVYRTNPKRLSNEWKLSLKAKIQTPQGKAVIGAAGAVVVLLIVRRVRKH